MEELLVIERRDRGVEAVRECCAIPELSRAIVPRKQFEAVFAHAVQQGRFDGWLVRVGIWPAGEADSTQAAVARRSDRTGRRIEVPVVTGLDSLGEQLEHGLFFDRCSRQDACAGRVAGDLANREPLRCGERRRQIEAEPTAAHRLPRLA